MLAKKLIFLANCLVGNALRRRYPESIIPKEVEAVFDEMDIERTWDYLQEMFTLNKKAWKEHFEEEFRTSSREYSKVGVVRPVWKTAF